MDERELIQEAKRGHPEAFEELVRRYQNRAFAFVFAHTRNREDARDIVQEVFMRIYSNLNHIDEDRKFFSYFYRTVQNRLISHFRKNRKEKTVAPEDIAEELQAWTNETLGPEEKIFLLDTLDTLPADERNLMILRYFQGLSDRELSETTGFSEDNIRVKIHRARKKLLKILGVAYD